MNDPEDDFVNPLIQIWDDQPISGEPAEFLEWFGGLTKTQQICFPTYWLCCEVYNGGFHQYFSNSTGLHAPESVEGFHGLGLQDIAEVVEKALSVFGDEFPRIREERKAFLDAIEGNDISEWNPFFLLDDEFYEAIKIPGTPELFGSDRYTVAVRDLVSQSL